MSEEKEAESIEYMPTGKKGGGPVCPK